MSAYLQVLQTVLTHQLGDGGLDVLETAHSRQVHVAHLKNARENRHHRTRIIMYPPQKIHLLAVIKINVISSVVADLLCAVYTSVGEGKCN